VCPNCTFGALIESCIDMAFMFDLFSDGRWLHPSPTRRSSDLSRHVTHPTDLLLQDVIRRARSGGKHGVRKRLTRTAPSEHRRNRSEEHTSELQSRENLVCRLLLEKKKKTQTQEIYQHERRRGN